MMYTLSIRKGMRVAAIAAALLLAGCSTTPEVVVQENIPVLEVNANFAPVEVASVEDIFALPPEAEKVFLDYYYHPDNRRHQGHFRLANYLNEMLQGFDYHHGTFSAADAHEKRTGNCLSLAILTTALADIAKIDVGYTQVHSAPIYKQHGKIMTLSSHVRTRLYEPKYTPADGTFVFGRRYVIIDYFPRRGNVGASNVSREGFIAKYFQNLAGEALVRGQFDEAYALIDNARKAEPNNPETLNTLAVLLRQSGQYDEAEKVYRHILDHTRGSLNSLSNYVVLLKSAGRLEESAEISELFNDIDDDNPYRWFNLGEEYFQNKQYRRAREYYQRSIDLGPYMSEAYLGLAKSYHMTGSPDKAQEAMEQALALTYIPEEQSLYTAKYEAMRRAQ